MGNMNFEKIDAVVEKVVPLRFSSQGLPPQRPQNSQGNLQGSVEFLPGATLRALPSYDCTFDSQVQGWELAAAFDRSPELPGAIVRSGSRVVGIISKPRFRYCMSQPYSLELYMQRPISRFLNTFGSEILRLPSDYPIERALREALTRNAEALYDPVAVEFPDGSVKLIDFYILLLAQNNMLVQYSSLLDAEKKQSKKHIANLQQTRKKLQRYATQLEAEKVAAQERNRQLEEQKLVLSQQQNEIVEQSREITDLNEKFLQLGTFLSLEGNKAFETMFERAEAISTSMKAIVATGKNLHDGLGAITDAANLIERLRQSVQDLVVRFSQASANSASSRDAVNWSDLQANIAEIGSKTFEASSHVGRIAGVFKSQIRELTAAALASEAEAQSFAEDSQQTRSALAELEATIARNSAGIEA